MDKAMKYLKGAALATVPVLGAALLVLALQLSAAVRDSRKDLAGISAQAGDLLQQGQKNLVLAGKLTNDARLTLDNVNKGAIDERFYFEKQLPSLMDQAHGILGNVQLATGDLHPLLTEATARTHALEPMETNAAQLEMQGAKILQDADLQITDPHIAAAIANVDTSSAQLVDLGREVTATGLSVQHIAADGEAEVHSLTHPKPLVSVANWTLKAVHALGGFF